MLGIYLIADSNDSYTRMSYQVLARKYRPQNFNEVAGQNHVLNSLVHALDQNRLHHAYLFTGTRGVGKTSLARLLAKSLNCLEGISSTPCQSCANCQSITNGSFVDLIEIDAASRTKVEDTREILDNVQYMPSQGRFKVYLIDEVHMLSTHSFNALLKTLEEPPEHVKFLLATTDPQKLPVTILSRCIQFHLKHLTNKQITTQLSDILTKEKISFDSESTSLIAHAADGSMRDALSLTDQAIAFGNGAICAEDIKEMLGMIDTDMIDNLIEAILSKEVNTILSLCDEINITGRAPKAVLDALANAFYYAGVFQFTKTYQADNSPCSERINVKLATTLSADMLQLYYQLSIKAKEDIALAPSYEVALGMALLRLCAFDKLERKTHSSTHIPENNAHPEIKTAPDNTQRKLTQNIPKPTTDEKKSQSTTSQSAHNWYEISQSLKLKGTTLQVALNSKLISNNNGIYTLLPSSNISAFVTDKTKEKLEAALEAYLQSKVKVEFVDTHDSAKAQQKPSPQKELTTPAQIQQEKKQNRIQQVHDSLQTNPDVQALYALGFELDPKSIRLKS